MKPRWQSFDPIEVGLAVREVSAQLIYSNSQAGKDRLRWFHSPHDVDLFVWTNDFKKIIKQQLTYFGMVLEWNVIEGLKTGQLDGDSRTGAHRGPDASELIKFDSKPVIEVVDRGRLLLAQITSLESALGRALDENFADTRSGTIMPAEEFIRRWRAR